MGLENFIDGDSKEKDKNTKSKTKTRSPIEIKDNTPSDASQLFYNNPSCTPRSIKYHIRCIGGNWNYIYSNIRNKDVWELVLYNATPHSLSESNCISVFSTITYSDVNPQNTKLNIDVCMMDVPSEKITSTWSSIEPSSSWTSELIESVESIYKKHIEF
jgi:hypothetical protein